MVFSRGVCERGAVNRPLFFRSLDERLCGIQLFARSEFEPIVVLVELGSGVFDRGWAIFGVQDERS